MNARADRVAIFLHDGAYDRLHQGCSIAATAAASGRPVDVFFFWFALEALASGGLATPRFAGREDLASRFEDGGFPTAAELVDHHVGWATILDVTRGVVDRFYF